VGTEENKRIAKAFLAAASARDADRVATLLSEDATFWRAGKPELLQFAGEQTKAQYCDYLRTPLPFKDRLSLTLGAITADDEHVAMEVGMRGVLKDDRVYDNAAHFLFTIRDGKIVSIREYMDTQHVAELFPQRQGDEL
jgi:uncharacterized protein